MDPAAETALDRLNQLALTSEKTADAITGLQAALTALRGQVETLSIQVTGLRDIQSANADQLAKIEHRLTAAERLGDLDGRLAAAQAAGEKTADRVEALAAEMARIGRVEAGLEQVRRDAAAELRTIEDRAKAERAELDRRHAAQLTDTAAALEQLRAAMLPKDAAQERFTAQDRARQELLDAVGRLTARTEALAGERAALEDITRRSESAAAARIDGLAKRIDDQHDAIGQWQARIEHQERTVSEARAIAAGVERTAEAVRDGERAAAEASRVFEARVESALDTFRQEASDEWRQHLALHDADRVQAERDRLRRSGERQAALDAALEAIDARLDALRQAIDHGLAERAEETMALYQQLAESFAAARDAFVASARAFEAPLPADAQPAMLAERRAALRRAMRARREGAGDER